jgi:hypothetical protein
VSKLQPSIMCLVFHCFAQAVVFSPREDGKGTGVGPTNPRPESGAAHLKPANQVKHSSPRFVWLFTAVRGRHINT